MSEPAKRTRRKRDDVAEDATAKTVPRECVYSAVSSRTCERGTDGCTVKHDDERKKALEDLLERSRRAERDELGTMLDERFAALRRDIDEKLDAIMIRLSGEVEKLSMRAVEVGDVASEPLVRAPTYAELWWEHVGNVWPTPQEELSLHSIQSAVDVVAKSAALHADALFVSVLKCYAADPKVSMQPGGRSATDLLLRLHEYLRVAVAVMAEAAK